MSIKKFLKTVFILSFVIMFASCVNSVEESVNVESEISYGFFARLQLDSNLYSDLSTTSRTAMPTLPSNILYYVDYVLDAEKTDISKHKRKTSNDSGVFYSSNDGFYLPLPVGKWVIEVGIEYNGTKILKDSKTVELTPEKPLTTDQVFLLKMSQTVGTGTGSMKLKITADNGAGVSSIKVILEDGTVVEDSNNDTFFEASSIPSGEQRIVINAYDNSTSPNLVYSTIQYINIYDNITTNQWFLNGPKETFEITARMTDDFKPRQYFVDGTIDGNGDDDNNTGTSSNSPFKTIAHTIDIINARAETYTFTIHVKDESEELDEATIHVQKNVTIECWKVTPNDRLGSAKVKVNGGDECVRVGPTVDDKKVNFYLESLADNNTSGLEINGNGGPRSGVYVQNGIFVMNGGVIMNTGDTTTEYGGVVLPDVSNNEERQFIMIKGTITENCGTINCGVYVGTDTILQMEGGVISENRAQSENCYAVRNNGEMSIKGQINISDNYLYNGSEKVFIDGPDNTRIYVNQNLYLPIIIEEGKKVLNRIQVVGPLSTNGQIGISAPVGTESDQLEPTGQKPVAITKNYMDTIAPSIIFKQDKSSPYVFMKSTDSATFGEASFGLGGGVFYKATDYSFSLASDTTSVTCKIAKDVTITTSVTRKESETATSELHYNPSDQKLYLTYTPTNEADSRYSNPVAEDKESDPDYNKVVWTAELTLAGNSLPENYQPTISAGTTDNTIKISIPALPYKDNYTLTITATYLGIQYGANFSITCN